MKQAGGTVIIQNPQTARYPSMPLALPPTIVDFTADIERIAPLLYHLLTGIAQIPDVEQPDSTLQQILASINTQTQIDFRAYKPSSLIRRIQRRMTALHLGTLDSYAEYLKNQSDEVSHLINTLLINVTEFFRDPEAYKYLKNEILPRLIAQAREREQVLRFWSAGCATGEEPYSLAMLLSDLLGSELGQWTIKIFATDLDEEAIAFARRGLFAQPLLKNVPAEYRSRFFERTEEGYRITNSLRQMITFGEHDLGRNGPFPHINLVLCRNVLIYFNVELQNMVLGNFAFALRPDGYLFLGKSETVRSSQSNYTLVSKKWKIYQYIGGATPLPIRPNFSPLLPNLKMPVGLIIRPAITVTTPDENGAVANELIQLRQTNKLLLRFLPMGIVVIDQNYRLLTANEAVRHLLGITDTDEIIDFLHAVRGIPYDVVRGAIDTVFRDKTTVTIPELELNPQMGGTGEFIAMIVSIMQTQASGPQLAAISMVNISESVLTRQRLEASQAEQARLLNELTMVNQQLNERNRELIQSNDALQVSNEELVLTHEELQASIEEFETTNEELQAANEELETTNEETQAINEELQTSNHELNARTLQLQELTINLRQEEERLRHLSRQLLDTQEIEKRTLALELHDQLGQELTGLGFLLDASMQNSSPEDEQLVQARTLTTQLIQRISQLALDLRPSMLDDLGLLPAINWYCKQYTSQTQIYVEISSYISDERFSPEVEITAYRIIQEAFTNVARHANVKTVYLEIRDDAEALYLRIKDTGRGFNLEKQTELHSTGLSSMRERTNLLGGQLTITTAPGKGTEIVARLPLTSM